MLDNAQILDKILTDLPYRPYCSNEKGTGLKIRPLQDALEYTYIQINPPAQIHYLVFDVDKKSAAILWEQAHVAPPNFITVNPENGHCHVVYKLSTAVTTSINGRKHPLEYLASIERAYRIELDADPRYSGLITRNPYKNQVWIIHEHAYELGELEDYLSHKLKQYKEPLIETSGLGRNVTLFDTVRSWAYTNIRLYRTNSRERLYGAWVTEVIDRTELINSQFISPLPFSEVKSTARSIAKFCWKHDPQAEQQFLMRQAERGRLGGKAKGLANADKRIQAVEMSLQGIPQTVIATQLDVSRQTINRWLNSRV